MKKILLPLLLVWATLQAEEATAPESTEEKSISETPSKPQRVIEDQIIVRVNGRNLLKSDLEIPRIGKAGGKYTLNEAILEELICQRAAEMHMLPSSLDIERQLVAFKIQNNLTEMSDAEFEKELQDNGFSLAMYKYQLGRLITVENVRRAEVSEKSLITSQEVEDYYQKHKNDPDAILKEKFHLKVCSIAEDKKPDNKQDLLSNPDITWEDLDWIERKHLKEEFNFVKTMKKGDISDPIHKDGSLEYVHLVDKQEKRIKTLDERYGEIELILQEKKRKKLWKKFENVLKEKANIIYLSEM